MRMAPAPVLQGGDGGSIVQQDLSNSRSTHGIVREVALRSEELEIGGLDSMPFVHGADDIADDRSPHIVRFPSRLAYLKRRPCRHRSSECRRGQTPTIDAVDSKRHTVTGSCRMACAQ